MTNEANVPWVDGLTIGQVLAATASRYPDREALVLPQSPTPSSPAARAW